LVVSDEIHQDFTYEGKAFVSSALVRNGKYNDILIILNAGSKTFNLAGLIHSHVIIFDKQLMETYNTYINIKEKVGDKWLFLLVSSVF
jgi:cystathionine beta-lyase